LDNKLKNKVSIKSNNLLNNKLENKSWTKNKLKKKKYFQKRKNHPIFMHFKSNRELKSSDIFHVTVDLNKFDYTWRVLYVSVEYINTAFNGCKLKKQKRKKLRGIRNRTTVKFRPKSKLWRTWSYY
jgi:hypothetical protein